MKNNEINELNKRFESISNSINNLMTVIFQSTEQNILYSLICKETDTFNKIENRLYEAYPECRNYEYFFIANGQRINRFKTLEENKIKNSQVITLILYEE